MNKILNICALLLISVYCFSQTGEIKPITAKPLQAPNNATWHFNTPDTAVWIAMGVYGQLKLASNQQLVKYYVPYDGANDTIDLNTQLITSKKQLLPLFNGVCSIPTILDNGDGSITVGNGEYHLSTRSDGNGTESYLISGGMFTLTDNTTNYLVADYNSGTPILRIITDVNLINETTIIPIYTAYRNGNFLNFQNWDSLGVALANKVHQSIVKTQRYRREYGLGISEYPTRYLSIGNGKVWVGAVPVTVDAVATSTDNLFLWYHSGGVWTLSVQSQYNNTQYDNGTNLATLTSNRYAVNWLFRGIESQKHLYIVLGRGDYTLTQAQEATVPVIPTAISSHAALIGKLIVQKGASTATSIQSAFDVQFPASTPSSHNDLTGRDATDVHPASSITNTPYSTISATNIQSAINELTDEKESISNKENTTVDNSTTKYPTVNLLKTYADTKVNTSVLFNKTNNVLEVTDSGGVKSDTIDINTSVLFNEFRGRITATSNPIVFNWPVAFESSDYNLDLYPFYYDVVDGKSIEMKNAVYNKTQTANGFSLYLDTIAGYVDYRAYRKTYAETPANVLLQSDLTTVVGTPGLDTKIPTEKAVRTAIDGFSSIVYPSAGIALSNGTSWSQSITDNHINWDIAYSNRISTLTTTGSSGAATLSSNTLNIPAYTLSGLGGQPLLNGSGIVKSTSGTISYLTDNTSNWDKYNQWDGGSNGLVAATGRTSLGGTTIGQNIFTLINPSAITFPRFNADNTISALTATDFKTALGISDGGTVSNFDLYAYSEGGWNGSTSSSAIESWGLLSGTTTTANQKSNNLDNFGKSFYIRPDFNNGSIAYNYCFGITKNILLPYLIIKFSVDLNFYLYSRRLKIGFSDTPTDIYKSGYNEIVLYTTGDNVLRIACSNGAETSYNTGITISSTNRCFIFEMNFNTATSVTFNIYNGDTKALLSTNTITTNIPTSALSLCTLIYNTTSSDSPYLYTYFARIKQK